MADSLRTSKIYHCLSLVTIDYLDLVGDNREFEV